MPKNFLELPSEIRNSIYEQLLVLEEPITSLMTYCDFSSEFRGLTLGLLLVNRIIHQEASSLLYAQNCFDFTTYFSNEISKFLQRIGHKNAQYIRHIRLDFPMLEILQLQSVRIERDSVKLLEEIRNACSNVTSITISLTSTEHEKSKLAANPSSMPEAIALVDTHFRTIPSLQDIIIEVYKECPNDGAGTEMIRHGWSLDEHERPQEDYLDFDHYDDYGDYGEYNDYDAYGDDWDTGYYSDYW